MLSQLKVTEFGIALRELAGTKTVVVVDEPGFHRFETHAQSFAGMVWNGQIYYFGATPPIDVLLVDAALARNSTAGTLDGWLTCFEKIAQGNPRLIVILCIALGAAIRRALREGLVHGGPHCWNLNRKVNGTSNRFKHDGGVLPS